MLNMHSKCKQQQKMNASMNKERATETEPSTTTINEKRHKKINKNKMKTRENQRIIVREKRTQRCGRFRLISFECVNP